MLIPGDVVTADNLGIVRIVSKIGGGGQGEVYVGESSSLGRVAVKWYAPQWATEQQQVVLDDLISRGTPDARFLWPISRVAKTSDQHAVTLPSAAGCKSFGYVMPLCEVGYVPLARLVNGNLNPASDPSFAAILASCRQLVESFRLLHAGGLCYRDISLGNVLLNPATGDIRICDVDNVSVDDGTSAVLGTPLFMAPEIVRDTTYSVVPSRRTDLHSLAVLLFVLLFMEHPLIGRRVDQGIWDEAHAQRHFGTDPLFIMSPTDSSNRAVKPHVERYWQLYPEFLRARMLTAFGEGLNDPRARVTEGEWGRVLTRLRDGMGTCPRCTATVFYDLGSPTTEVCVACGAPLADPLVLVTGRRQMVASRHLLLGADLDRSGAAHEPIGRAVVHPQDGNRLGLKNLTARPWTVTMPDGVEYTVAPQQAIELTDGITVRAGDIVAEVRHAVAAR
jgi:eukaryotic-like serine/threonine-protein kinase